jgi:flagellar FliL protein
MSEEAQSAQQTENKAASGKKKLIIIAAACVVVLAGIGVPATMMLLKKEAPKLQDLPADAAEEEVLPEGKLEGKGEVLEFEEGEELIGAIVPFDTFLVNIAGGKYIRLQVQVEFESLDVPSRFYTRMVPLRDGIISLLSQQSAEDLEGAKGKDKLKTQIRKFMNETLRREDVKRVYFTQFVIQ